MPLTCVELSDLSLVSTYAAIQARKREEVKRKRPQELMPRNVVTVLSCHALTAGAGLVCGAAGCWRKVKSSCQHYVDELKIYDCAPGCPRLPRPPLRSLLPGRLPSSRCGRGPGHHTKSLQDGRLQVCQLPRPTTHCTDCLMCPAWLLRSG